MIQIIIKYGKPIILAVTKSGGAAVAWIWGIATGSSWGISTPSKRWGIPQSTTTPSNLSAPTITGTAIVNQTLIINGGTWSAVPYILKYDIYKGATLLTSLVTSNSSINYTVLQSDAGGNISCIVSAINSAGTTVAPTSNTVTILTTLIDVYPNAAAAYSVRLLRGAYYGSPALRVRRSNDNAELDISFTTSGNLDTSTLTTFVGANSAFVTTWYDQSGNANNAIQTTPANQPQIVNSGSVIIQGTKPIISFNGSSNHLATVNSNFSSVQTTNIFVSKQSSVTGTYKRGISIGKFNQGYYLGSSGVNSLAAIFNGALIEGGTATNYNVAIQYNTSTNGYLVQNGLQVASTSTTVAAYGNQKLFIGTDSNITAIELWNGVIQEAITYPVAQTSNLSGLQSNINNYYGIY